MNRWDITVKQSNYDFNPFRESDHGKYFKTVANIYEDWSKELESLAEATLELQN